MPRLGCHIIYGPTFTTSGGITYASFVCQFRNAGGEYWRAGASRTPIRWLQSLEFSRRLFNDRIDVPVLSGGTEIQAADPLVIAAYPTAPVAHRGQCCVFIENLALTDFNLKVPFVSAVIAETYAWNFDDSDGGVKLPR